MTKRLNALQTFYIDNNLGLSDTELAKTTGATLTQVKARRIKIVGKNREGGMKGEPEQKVLNQANPERQAELENQAQKAAALQPTTETVMRPAPAMRIDALLAKQNGTVSLTQAASELADMFDGISPDREGKPMYPRFDPFADTTKVHKIK